MKLPHDTSLLLHVQYTVDRQSPYGCPSSTSLPAYAGLAATDSVLRRVITRI